MAQTLLALVVALLFALISTNIAVATTPPGANLSNMDEREYKILRDNKISSFSHEEVVALDEMLIPGEVDELIAMIESSEKGISGEPVRTSLPKPQPTLFSSWQPNGCSKSPDNIGKANFKPICNNHDACYASFSRSNRLDCDNYFRDSLKLECNRAYPGGLGVKRSACRGVADIYYNMVRKYGASHYHGKGKNN